MYAFQEVSKENIDQIAKKIMVPSIAKRKAF